jgi:elongation factor P--(R)-beta-lysine ligase
MRLRHQFELIQLIRNFFCQQGFLDVITPPLVENPGMEVHIHPFQVYSVNNQKLVNRYLHTSPEFCLKDILTRSEEDINKLFSISYCFRDEPSSKIHRHQFIMLEWYRRGARYEQIMDDAQRLISNCVNSNLPIRPEIKKAHMIKKTMAELFQDILNIDILNYLDTASLKDLVRKYPDVPLPAVDCEWDDYFFLLYLNKIEPEISKIPMLMIYEFPAPLAALSTIKKSDPRVCERFEIYINGIELCNCFNELTNLREQQIRFQEQNKLKQKLYHYQLPEPQVFYSALERGLPDCAGIALGIERLYYALCEVENPFFY